MTQPEHPIRPLLDHLASDLPKQALRWGDWQIAPILGGANNLLYRACGEQGDLAIKFTIRDERDRAGREQRALLLLQRYGLAIAPVPILLDHERYAQPVIVQSWLEGASSATPPATDDEWGALIRHFATIHSIDPGDSTHPLQPCVLTMTSAADGLQRFRHQLGAIPTQEQPAALQQLARQLEQRPFPAWPTPPLAWSRCDPNPSNFIRRPGEWASVDWENSGWGDPAFEIADMMAHPAYLGVETGRWDEVIGSYCALRGDPGAAIRIRVYYLITLAWWVARFARSLYEVPRGLDRRLAERPPGWLAETQQKYERYIDLALRVL